MNKIVLGALGLLACAATSATAADLPAQVYTKAVVPPPVWSWTGFYVGAQGGWDEGRADYFIPRTGFDHKWNTSGGFGGAMVGYNYQFNQLVVGIQGEYNGADIRGSEVNVIGNLQSASLTKFGSIDGRLGVAWNQVLFYGIGGVAFGNPKQTFTIGPVAGGGRSVTFGGGNTTGWDAGVGVEAGFAGNWTARVEYRHYDWGSLLVQPDYIVLAGPHQQKATDDTIRLGVAYKFGY
jgi:outer membrane immunogenic protein